MRIGLISDTHSYMDQNIIDHLTDCDEIWHAGDIGDRRVIDTLEGLKTVRAVYGNIDHGDLRHEYPLDNRFTIEGLDIYITHIGGYPGRYNKRVTKIFKEDPPGLFICGHSHICKVMYDKQYQFLHINPGACGHHGFHKMRTITRFTIESGKVKDMQVIELGLRGYKEA